MNKISEDIVLQFRDRLFYTKVPELMKKGSKEHKPLETFKLDDSESIVIPTSAIVDFFLDKIDPDMVTDPHIFFSNLYLLLDKLTIAAEPFSFKSDTRIPENAIQEADNKHTIRYLAKNLIITYFNNLKLGDGTTDTGLLDKNLKKLIQLSGTGRDYKTLVQDTLEKLVITLKENDSWRKCLADISEAVLVCRLVGAQLPEIEKTVISRFIQQSREEIKKQNELLARIIYTMNRLIAEEANLRQYLKTMEKIKAGIREVLRQINDYLVHANIFMRTLGSTPATFMGEEDELLKNNLARLFTGFEEKGTQHPAPDYLFNYASARYRLNHLYDHEALTKFCRGFQHHDRYQQAYLNLFDLFFSQLSGQIDKVMFDPVLPRVQSLASCLFEVLKATNRLGLDDGFLEKEKKSIQQKYVALVKTVEVDLVDDVLALKEDICDITRDKNREFMNVIRQTLVSSFYSALLKLPLAADSPAQQNKKVLKLLNTYSAHYKPQRFFYQDFFKTYVVDISKNAPSTHLDPLVKGHRHTALALFNILADPRAVVNLLNNDQIEYASQLLEKLKTGKPGKKQP